MKPWTSKITDILSKKKTGSYILKRPTLNSYKVFGEVEQGSYEKTLSGFCGLSADKG